MKQAWIVAGTGIAAVGVLMWKRGTNPPPPPYIGHDPVSDSLAGTVPQSVRDFAQAIALAEGFGVPGAVPTRNHNPGDIKVAGQIGSFADDMAGWQALYRQLGLIVSGTSRYYRVTDTIAEMSRVWTATEQSEWAANVVSGLNQLGYNVTENTTLRDVFG